MIPVHLNPEIAFSTVAGFRYAAHSTTLQVELLFFYRDDSSTSMSMRIVGNFEWFTKPSIPVVGACVMYVKVGKE